MEYVFCSVTARKLVNDSLIKGSEKDSQQRNEQEWTARLEEKRGFKMLLTESPDLIMGWDTLGDLP